MPFLQNEDEELKQQNAGQISGPSAGPMSSAAPQKAPSAKSSGSWTNLQTYMNANKDNAAAMGQTVAKSADDAGKQANEQVQGFQAKTPQAVKTYTADDLQTEFYNNPNATKEQYQQFKTTGGYTGPSSLEDMGYSGVESSVKKADEAVKGIQTEEGRQKTLGEIYKKPSYTAGQKTFDNLLIQNSPEARQAAQGVGQRWSNLTNTLKSATDAASAVIPQNIATASANAGLIPAAETQAKSNILSPIQQRVVDQTKANQEHLDRVRNDISTLEPAKMANADAYYNRNVISPETAALMGLQPGGQMRTYGVDINQFLTPNQTQLGANDLATQEERGKWGALMNLLGGGDNTISAEGVQNAPALSFDNKAFMDAVKAAEASGTWKQGLAEDTWSSPEKLAAWQNAEGWLDYGGSGAGGVEDPLAFLLPKNSFGGLTGGLKG